MSQLTIIENFFTLSTRSNVLLPQRGHLEVRQGGGAEGGEVRKLAVLHDLRAALLLYRCPRPHHRCDTGGMAVPEVQVVPQLQEVVAGRQVPVVRRLRRGLPRSLPEAAHRHHTQKWVEVQEV